MPGEATQRFLKLQMVVPPIDPLSSSGNKDNGTTEHSNSMIHLSERLPYTESASSERRTNGYAELGGEMKMSKMRGEMAHRSPDYSNETTVEGGSGKRDVQALVPTGIMKTVDLQLSYPVAAHNTKRRVEVSD